MGSQMTVGAVNLRAEVNPKCTAAQAGREAPHVRRTQPPRCRQVDPRASSRRYWPVGQRAVGPAARWRSLHPHPQVPGPRSLSRPHDWSPSTTATCLLGPPTCPASRRRSSKRTVSPSSRSSVSTASSRATALRTADCGLRTAPRPTELSAGLTEKLNWKVEQLSIGNQIGTSPWQRAEPK